MVRHLAFITNIMGDEQICESASRVVSHVCLSQHLLFLRFSLSHTEISKGNETVISRKHYLLKFSNAYVKIILIKFLQ